MGFQVEGFTKGTFIRVVKSGGDQVFSMRKSLKGRRTVLKNSDVDYDLTFSLDNTAGANTWLHAIHQLQKLYGVVFPVPVLYKDNNGSTTFFCATAILDEPEEFSQGNEVESNEWTLMCPKALFTIGGSTKNPLVADILSKMATMLSAIELANIDITNLQWQANELLDKARSSVGGFLENFR